MKENFLLATYLALFYYFVMNKETLPVMLRIEEIMLCFSVGVLKYKPINLNLAMLSWMKVADVYLTSI